jgi:Zn-dependent alcohol dehydrogenase
VDVPRELRDGLCRPYASPDEKINIDDLTTHTLPLSEINHAFHSTHVGESIRGVVML